MLDVHPPHEAAHSWKDFFIHIATIVIGLLIAIGLEQTVERFHHLHVQHQARERMREEVEVNQRILSEDKRQMQKIFAELDRDVVLLRTLQAGAKTAGKLDFSWNLQGFYDAAYNNAREAGALRLMPYQEAAMFSDAYMQSQLTTNSTYDLVKQLDAANADMRRGHTEAQLTPEEISDLLKDCSKSLAKAQFTLESLDALANEWDASLSGHYRQDFGESSQ